MKVKQQNIQTISNLCLKIKIILSLLNQSIQLYTKSNMRGITTKNVQHFKL